MLSDDLRAELGRLRAANLEREPRIVERVEGPFAWIGGRKLLSFASNDYLGIGQDPRVAEAAGKVARDEGWGICSSRALSGTTRWHAALEEAIAAYKGLEAALLFSSGFAANLGMITTLADRDTLIVSDELNHASLIDACRLSRARVEIYPHADAAAAGRALGGATKRFVLTDTVFSMDGDLAPLAELRKLGADVVVDDVHGFGVFGPKGRGSDAAIQSGNLSKAAGGIGGFVAGSKDLVALLRSKARSFLFTTACPPAICAAGVEAIRILREADAARERLFAHLRLLESPSPIKTVILGSNERALAASATLFERGFFVPAIRPPTVAPGSARLRLTVTAMHEREHVEALLEALRKI